MTVTEHRHAQRQHQDRWATFRFDWLPEGGQCRVIDAWFDGAVIELFGVERGEQLAGRRLHVGSFDDDPDSLAIRTSVRGWVRLDNGRLIVLVQFGTLTPEARRFLLQRAAYRSLV
jgi:hypothetical protein